MKILFVDLKYDYGIIDRGPNIIGEDGFHKTFLKLHHTVDVFYYDHYLRPPRLAELQKDLILYAERSRPDLIFFILFEDQFFLETLHYLKSKYTTVNWFCDDQWRFDDFTAIYAPAFTCCITTDKYAVQRYHAIGQPNVILSQWAAIDQHPMPAFTGYHYDVTFVGGIHPYRKWFIKSLNKRGINVKAFGHGWPNGSVSPVEMNSIIRSSKINLNISNSACYDLRYVFSNFRNLISHFHTKKRYSQIKARNFEIPFFGGFQLAEYVPGLEDHFSIGNEVICYKDIDEAELLIKHFLHHSDQREHIRQQGHAKACKSHGYFERLKTVFEQMSIP